MNICWTQSEQNILVSGARMRLQNRPTMQLITAIRNTMFEELPVERHRPKLNSRMVDHLIKELQNTTTAINVPTQQINQQVDTKLVDSLAEVFESVIVQTIKRLLINPEISAILQQLLNKSK